MWIGLLGLAAGLALIAAGVDGLHTRRGAVQVLMGLMSLAGLALAGLSILKLCVPHFFQL